MKMRNITNKKILFFSPSFFRYEFIIADKMREMGAKVDMYDERSVTRAMDKALLKIIPDIFEARSRAYYDRILHEKSEQKYDYILIIKCDMTPISILKKMKENYPDAKLVLYLYDSLDNIPRIEKKLPLFDSVYSFDLDDCRENPALHFRPLFYSNDFCKPLETSKDYLYDVGFFGTIHSDRYSVIKQVKSICQQKGLRGHWFCYLQSKFIYYFYKLTKTEFRTAHKSDFSFQKLSGVQISNLVDKTRTILDVQHPRQTGLTMRTIEMIGMNKKLITTNATIKDYDFYNPNNICIIDRKQVVLPDGFLKQEYTPLPQDIYEKYSLQNWVLDVLS